MLGLPPLLTPSPCLSALLPRLVASETRVPVTHTVPGPTPASDSGRGPGTCIPHQPAGILTSRGPGSPVLLKVLGELSLRPAGGASLKRGAH